MNRDEQYTSYQGMVAQVNTSLVQMEEITERLDLSESQKTLAKHRKKLSGHTFAVGILGEFRRGKSTVINSLLEKEIMPSDILPTSATMNRVTYDLKPHAELILRDGTIKPIGIEELPRYVTKLSPEDEERAALVEEAIVYYPCKFCQNGVDIIDTPGLNDDDRMSRITEEVIPKLDAVIMVVTHDSPFSMSEAEFVRSKLMTSDLSRLIFLVNKIDMIRKASDKERIVQDIKRRVQKSVMDKMAEVYGENSREYEDAKLKVGQIRIYPFSALDALEGKMEGDPELIAKSGTLPFEEELTHMLTEERGALELRVPINVIEKTAIEIAKTVETRRQALKLSSEEFERCQKALLTQLNDIRQQKTEEKKRLRIAAMEVRNEMIVQTQQFYPQLKQKLEEVLDTTPIDLDTLKSDAGQQAAAEMMQKAVTAELEASMSIYTEKIENQLKKLIGKESIKLGEFTQKISQQLDDFHSSLNLQQTGMDKDNLMNIGMGVLTDYMGILGVGSILAGYREAGVKGAIAGGGVGVAAHLAVATMLASMSVVGLPLVVISCAAGAVVSKHFSRFLFGKDVAGKRLEAIRETIRKNLQEMLDEMQARGELEDWIRQRVDTAYEELSDAMEEECEKMLKDTQNTMDAIKQDLMQNQMQRDKLSETYEESLSQVKQILAKLKPIAEKVAQVLREDADIPGGTEDEQ